MTIAVSVQLPCKRILVATDFTPNSERTALLGLEIARLWGASLHVLHVVPKEGYGVTGVHMLGAAEFARRDARRLELELLQRGYLEGIAYQVSVEKGEVWPVVARVTETERIGLVIVGSHRRTGLGKLFAGSTAERVFRQSCCPVLVAGPNLRSSHRAGLSGKILVPIDIWSEEPCALPLTKSLAHEMQAQVIFLHAIRTEGRESTYNKDRAMRYAQSRMRELVALPNGVGLPPECVVETGEPADVIVNVASQRAVDMVLLGVRSPSMFSDRLRSSTACRVVQQASCPVLTVSRMQRQRGCGEQSHMQISDSVESLSNPETVMS